MKIPNSENDIFFKIGIALILIYFLYFSGVLLNLYNIFHEYTDFTIYVYNLYYNMHYPQVTHGLQFIAFDQHLSPDSVFLMVIYYIFQSPVTLLILQLVFMCLTAFVILYAVREFTGDNLIALLLSFAFLINAGTLGLIIYDSHVEFLIPLLYILSLYTYIKSEFRGFVVSSLLLLGSADVTPLMALMLGIGLVFYEFTYNKGKLVTKTNVSFAYLLIVLSIAALGFYYIGTHYLEAKYVTEYANLPPTLKINNGAQNMVAPSFSSFISNPIGKLASNIHTFALGYKADLIYAILLIAFGFGLALFLDPIIALIFALPWLSGIFILGDPNFVLPLSEYFGYIIGPAAGAAILGILIYKKRDTYLSRFMRANHLDLDNAIVIAGVVLPVLLSLVGPAVYLFALSPLTQYHSFDAATIGQILFFESNSSQVAAYSQLNSVLNQVPQNASVMAQYYDTAHLANRQYVDSTNWNGNYFQPQYVLLDFNKNISSGMCIFDNCTALNDLVVSGNYSVYAINGTATLYKRI